MIKTGLESQYVPYSPEATYISVLRDPKAVFVSGYHFVTGLFGMGAQINMDQWLDQFLSTDFIGGSWALHTVGYWRWRDRPNVLILSFNDMKDGIAGAVSECADIMGVPLNHEEHTEVVRRADFECMKTDAEKFNPPRFRFVPEAKRSATLRTGSSSAGNELTPEQGERIDSYIESELEPLNCDLPYAEMFRS
ncbi:MAG: hypothetical protein ACI9BW_003012 [Gammaproteobacteria bacterium]|jgi:hypothetical protein